MNSTHSPRVLAAVACLLALSSWLTVAARQSSATKMPAIFTQAQSYPPGRSFRFAHPAAKSFGADWSGLVSAATGPIFFNPASYSSAGVYAFSSVTGDFNGDGKPDLAVANECFDSNCNSGGVSVLLGNGDGTFQAAQTYGSGGYEAMAIAVADVNGDGKADLVVANGCAGPDQCANGAVGVLLGNGDGTFQTAQSYPSGGLVAVSVAVGDFNRDGHLDLALANQCEDSACTAGGVGILLGNGDGTFQSAQLYPSGGLTAVSVTIGYFSGDEQLDLAVANQCQNAACSNGNVGILLGKGDGSFQLAHTYNSGGYNSAFVVTGDFNGDKKTDLAIASECPSANDCTSGSVEVLLGNGNGTFQPAQSFASGGISADALAVSDVNGDGRQDLLVTNQCESGGNCVYGSVAMLLGNGSGSFQLSESYISFGLFASSIEPDDFNGDGKPDLAFTNQCAISSACTGNVTILLGNGDGTFQAPPTYGSGGYDADSVAVGDMNGDKKLDLVVANLCNANDCTNGDAGVVDVLLGNGDGTFQAPQAYASGGYGASSVAIADVNSDGKLDVVVANQCATSDCSSGGGVSVLLGNGDGTLQPAVTYAAGALTSLAVAIADFNNDGKLDIALANQCQDSTCTNGSLSILLGNGDGTFQSAQTYPSGGYKTDSLAVGDFNRDGNLDVALASQCEDNTCQSGGVSVLLGSGNGAFQTAQSYHSGGVQADSIAVSDLTGNGKLDLVVANLCQNSDECSQGSVVSLIGKGDGTFHYPRGFSSGGKNTYSVITGDFNGDGNQDVVVTSSDCTCVLLGNGNATFQAAIPYDPGGIFVATGDFNGDAQPDVAVARGSISDLTILLNVVQGYRQATTTTLVSSPDPSAVFQSVQFTATITSQAAGAPTGTVTFKNGTTVLGTANVSDGEASLNYSFSSKGTYWITASYSGDSEFLPSTSAPLRQGVTKAKSTTTLGSAPNPSNLGQAVQFTATVTGQYGGIPTGTVTFKNDGQVMAQVQLSSGVAQYETFSLTQGNHRIVAAYGGDTNFGISSGSLTQVVQ